MIILGLDPGLARLGYGIIESDGDRHSYIAGGIIETTPKQTLPERLTAIFDGVGELMDTYGPEDVAVEELFFAQNVTTGITVGAARGAALVAVAKKTSNLYEYTPLQVKMAVTGYGRADKRQVQEMVKLLLKMNEIIRPDDAADAAAVAIAHANSMRMRHLYKIK